MKLSDEELAGLRAAVAKQGPEALPMRRDLTDGIIATIDGLQADLDKAATELAQARADAEKYLSWVQEANTKAHRLSGDCVALRVELSQAQAELAAMRAGAPADGWRLVPVEPTEHMVMEGAGRVSLPHAATEADASLAIDAYVAMLAAAPQPPAQPVAVEARSLAWKKQSGGDVYRASLPFVGSLIVEPDNSGFYVGISTPGLQRQLLSDLFGEAEQAIEAAEAHYRSTILSTINARSVDEVKAERDRLMSSLWANGWVIQHASDCAVHNEPAMPAGPCDCGAEKARNGVKAEALREAAELLLTYAQQSHDKPLSNGYAYASVLCRKEADRLDPKGGTR